MGQIFNGVSAKNIELFFLKMMLSDGSMPHTPTRLSPITFSEFLNRNQIVCLNQLDVYKEACNYWSKYAKDNPELLHQAIGGDSKIFLKCETKRNDWNVLMDYLERISDVKDIAMPHYKMHYIAHVCYLFFAETMEMKDVQLALSIRRLFNQLICPIIYEPIIPTNYCWMPVKSCFDVHFPESVEVMLSTVSTFIKNHTSRYVDYKKFDKAHLDVVMSSVKSCLKNIQNTRYQGYETWKNYLSNFMNEMSVVDVDCKCCEFYDAFKRDGFQICNALEAIERTRKAYEKGHFEEDADAAIDSLLDAYSVIKTGLEKYEPVKKGDQ